MIQTMDLARRDRIRRAVPYFGLLVSTLFSLVNGPVNEPRTAYYSALVFGGTGLAACWVAWWISLHPAWAERPRPMAVYYAGLLLLILGLIWVNPLYGFFGFTGYVHTSYLQGDVWKRVGVFLTAAMLALTQIGGFGNVHSRNTFIGYLGLVAVNATLALIMVHAQLAEVRRMEEQTRMVDELAEANRKLHDTMEENAGLHAQLVAQAREAGVLDERQRLAGEIHDTIAQGLTGIVTQLEAAERADADPDRRRRHLDLARRLARESLAEARRSVQALRPGPLVAAHLPEALADLATRWSETSAVPVRVEISGDPVPLPPALEVVLFRTAQEALTNVGKHAAASQAGLTLSYTSDVVVLDVLDDGVGLENGAGEGTGYGLSAMRQRLRQVGGLLEIESVPGEGTAISARVPALSMIAAATAD